MKFEISKDDVGSFELAIVGDADGGSVNVIANGSAVALLCGINVLTRHLMEAFGRNDHMLKEVLVRSMTDTLNGKTTAGIKFASEETASTADVKPSASPNQEQVDKMLDKLFGRTS